MRQQGLLKFMSRLQLVILPLSDLELGNLCRSKLSPNCCWINSRKEASLPKSADWNSLKGSLSNELPKLEGAAGCGFGRFRGAL